MARRRRERATYAPQARSDLLAAVRWIRKDNPAAARALRQAVDEAAGRIARHPELGRFRPDIATSPFRFLTLTGFPYVIFYNSGRTPPRILRILHGARDLPELLRDL
jgi:toxin ParE1/3/4